MAEYNTLEICIMEALVQSVADAHKECIVGDANWTKLFKQRLGELGESRGYSVATGGFEADYEREWLYDMTWYKESNKDIDVWNRRLTEVGLVVESEWSFSKIDVKYDFEKLLVANAAHRLMICQAKEKDIEEYKKYFKEAINAYEQGSIGNRFLIAILDTDTEVFDFELFIKQEVKT